MISLPLIRPTLGSGFSTCLKGGDANRRAALKPDSRLKPASEEHSYGPLIRCDAWYALVSQTRHDTNNSTQGPFQTSTYHCGLASNSFQHDYAVCEDGHIAIRSKWYNDHRAAFIDSDTRVNRRGHISRRGIEKSASRWP